MTNMSLAKLEQEFKQSIGRLGVKIDRFPWRDQKAYHLWIAQTYYLVRHTTRLICLAAAKCGLEDEEFHQKSLWHIKEEMGHEKVALADIRSLGIDLAKVEELPATTSIYQSQYFFVERFGPYSQLGYSMMLEGLAAEKGHEVVKIVSAAHGPKAARFLKVHAEEDKGHVEAGMAFLASLSADQLESIQKNLKQGCILYGEMLDAIAATASEQRRFAGAA